MALTSLQKQFYRAIYEKNTNILFRGCSRANQPSLMNVMMELRKCCNHPYLNRGAEELILAGELPQSAASKDETTAMDVEVSSSNAAPMPSSPGSGDQDSWYQKLVQSSGKLVLLDKLLPKLFSQGHKVLIFSQMVKVLNILEDFLRYQGYLYERLDGSSKSVDRNASVQRFCKPSQNRFVMLLSTKAGGLGLNLTAADTVIIYGTLCMLSSFGWWI